MKILTIILLLVFFTFICIGLTHTIEKFQSNVITTEADLNENNNDNKKDNDKNNNKKNDNDKDNKDNNDNDNDDNDKDDNNKDDNDKDNKKKDDNDKKKDNKITMIEHPATETADLIKKQDQPIHINISYNVEPPQIETRPNCKTRCPSDYIPGSVTNRYITTGYGDYSSLGNAPFMMERIGKHCLNNRNPNFQRSCNFLGSTDHAKIPQVIIDAYNDDPINCYTILKDKYISFPQERHSVTDLAENIQNKR